MKKMMLGIIIGGLIFGSMVYAASYNANDITYTKNGVETNVNEALNELYNVQNELDECQEKKYELKRTTSPNSTSINVKEYSDNWAELTNESFAVITNSSSSAVVTAGHQYRVGTSASGSVSWSYNSNTGLLTITLKTGTGTGQGVSDNGAKTTTITSTVTPVISAVYLYELKQE